MESRGKLARCGSWRFFIQKMGRGVILVEKHCSRSVGAPTYNLCMSKQACKEGKVVLAVQ